MTDALQTFEATLQRELSRWVVGAQAAVHALAIALVARGHVLLEGPPGVGKTLLGRALAQATGGAFQRIQGTADLMPADILGAHVFEPQQGRFRFHPGPLFADVVLVDEINRTGPRTQSALLEAMAERQVTLERETCPLPEDFLVIATQNPLEYEGTYPLPESQLDRFMLRVEIGYAAREAELEVLRRYGARFDSGVPPGEVIAPIERGMLAQARNAAAEVHVAEAVAGYVLDLARATREHPRIALGLSTRGALALLRAARIAAGMRGSAYTTADDVKAVAPAVMTHRLVLTAEAAVEELRPAAVVDALLERTPVPR
jgi:MoxR-like ATPase